MKKIGIVIVIAAFIFACSSVGQENNADLKNIAGIDASKHVKDSSDGFIFISKIRPDATDLSPKEVYIDKLTFLNYNDDYDYGFCIFVTGNGDTVSLYHNDPIEELYRGRSLMIKWKVDTFYEAGENEEMYFQESLISFELIKK